MTPLLLVLLACTEPAPDAGRGDGADPAGDGGETTAGDTGAADEDDDPSEYVYEDDETGQDAPLHELDEVSAGVVEVLETATRVDPQALTAGYDALRLSLGDGDCPYYYTDGDGDDYNGYQYWSDSCTTASGATFEGYGLSYVYAPYNNGTYDYDDQSYVSVYGTITDRLGDSLEMAGRWYHYTYGPPGTRDRYGYAYLIGDARWSDDDAAGTWMAEDLSLDLIYSWSYDGDVADGTAISVEGSLSGMTGPMNSALLTDFFLYTADRGSDCELEPSGTVSVRDAAGEWYHVEFHGPAWSGAPVFDPDCDGCGEVSWRGQYLGEVCPDFSALTTWELRPWQ